MNELDMIKLNIFEAFDNDEITYGEKEYLLEQVDYMYEADAFTKRIRKYDDLSKSSNPYLSKAADKKKLKLKVAYANRGRYDGIVSKNPKDKSHPDVFYILQRNDDRKARKSDKLANKTSGSILDMQKQKDEAVAKLIKAGMTPEEAKKAISNTNKRPMYDGAYIDKKPKATQKKSRDNYAHEFEFANESTFDTLLESINDLYYED